MTFSARYEVTAQLQDAMASQFFYAVLRSRLPVIVACFAVLAGLGALDLPYRAWVAGFLSAVALLIVITWVKTYFAMRAQARAGLKLMEQPRVELTLDNSRIVYRSSTGTREHAWVKIERLVETKDFVILMAGKLPLLSLPKAAFEASALSFLRARITPAAGSDRGIG